MVWDGGVGMWRRENYLEMWACDAPNQTISATNSSKQYLTFWKYLELKSKLD